MLNYNHTEQLIKELREALVSGELKNSSKYWTIFENQKVRFAYVAGTDFYGDTAVMIGVQPINSTEFDIEYGWSNPIDSENNMLESKYYIADELMNSPELIGVYLEKIVKYLTDSVLPNLNKVYFTESFE